MTDDGQPPRVSIAWMWVAAAIPFGLGAWAPIVAGYRARHRGWMLTGAVLCAATLAATTVASAEDENRFGGGLIIVSWAMTVGAVAAIAPAYRRRMAARAAVDERATRAEVVLDERREVIALARENPERAKALGVGRPDLPDARHGHVVDVNHAPADVVATLPGVSDALAREIVTLREELGGFDSIEDLGALMELHPRVVDAMRSRAVALP